MIKINPLSLDQVKQIKKQELDNAFNISSKLPITVGTKSYNGGKESAQAIRDYIDYTTEKGIVQYYIWGTDNLPMPYTLAEANAIKLAISDAVVSAEFNLRTKKNVVNDATTITAVNAVVF